MVTRALVLVLLTALLLPGDAGAYMALLRQGVESAEVPNTADHYGDRIATGDFNGDGYDDIAVAAPDENNDIGVGRDHGVVIVSYGSPTGITHLGADVLSVGSPDDFNVNFGKGLAAGDFDGDGTDDLAVGIPGLDRTGDADVGGVWVYAGTPGVGIQLAPYIRLDQADCGATVEAGDQFGYSLCAGDMGGDGFDDLFVGAIGEDDDAGLVAFFPGSAGGVTPTGSGFAKQSSLGGVDGAGDLFGYSLALGDFIGDGNLDLAAGAPYADEGSLLDMGKVYVIRGTAFGPVVGGGEVHTPASLAIPFQLGKAFGWSLAAGVFLDDDGARPDLAIGEPLYDVDGNVTSGRVVVIDYDGPGDVVGVGPQILDQGVLGEPINAGAAFGWSLAAGNIMTNAGIAGPDGLDDLAIGAPQDDVPVPGGGGIFFSDVGTVYLVPGSHSSFSIANAKVIDAMERNDLWFDFDENMGWSLAFGKFDDTGWDNMAIGVPNKHFPAYIDPETQIDEAGQVYVMAPWRQPAGYPHRSSILYDCSNEILYAQRFKQRLTPASTTKALTALIAAEAIQDGTIPDPDALYTIPDWVANEVNGSQFGLFATEQISFIDLVRTMIAVSGNDCSYAIGNILTGEDSVWDYGESRNWNLENTMTEFAAMMNARATQLGMSSSHTFTNPAGRPVGDHWTTAEDMAIFVHEAMKNPLFADIVGTRKWEGVFRIVPFNALFPWFPPNPMMMPIAMDVTNTYFDAIADSDPRAAGVKGGFNPPSAATGLYSARLDFGGFAKATIFGVPPYGWLRDFGAELLSMVGDDCSLITVTPVFPEPDPFPDSQGLDIPVDPDQGGGTTAQLDPEDEEDACIEILRATRTTTTTCVAASICRTAEFDLGAGETRSFGGTGWDGVEYVHWTVTNRNDVDAARFSVQSANLGIDEDVVLEAGATWRMPTPPLPSAGQDGSDLLLFNNGDGSDFLEVHHCLGFEITLGDDRFVPPEWKIVLTRGGVFHEDDIDVIILGCGPADGNTVHVSVHPPGVAVSVDDTDDVPPLTPSSILHVENSPNPFNPQTVIRFEIDRRSTVSLRIYDLAGRLVRTLEPGRDYPAGEHAVEWNGTDASGLGVASGVYLVRLDAGGTARTLPVTLVK